MRRALLSVSDKSGIVPFAKGLVERGWSILSTGGTARALRDGGLMVTEVSEATRHAEILGGRVKTLHPVVHAGLLARRGHDGDAAEMAAFRYELIDLLAVNLYPFGATIAQEGVSDAEAIEQIDIGGPAMLRSAAKNHEGVWVLVDPHDYTRVLEAIDGNLEESVLRRELAAKVFAHTSSYDTTIASYLRRDPSGPTTSTFPQELVLALEQVQALRYGENPDQSAAFYRERGTAGGLPQLEQLHGRELSFNNLLDVEAARLTIAPWAAGEIAVCAIVKHATPCGVAVADSIAEAYRKALATDPTSAFGSVVALNKEVSEDCAELLAQSFVEVVVAPAYAEGALERLRRKKNLRLLVLPLARVEPDLDYKRVQGGFLVQGGRGPDFPETGWKVVTRRTPTPEEQSDLAFAWRAVAAVRSNAILIARGGATLGIGAGQMSRVDSSRIAVMKARDNNFDLQGSVLASDAFFPFRDGVDAAAEAGVRAIIQPGGSIRDDEVIQAADEHDVAMVFTGTRLFRH